MPYAAPHPCAHPGCPKLTHDRRCREHRREEWKEQDRNRPSAVARGYGSEWRKASRQFLRENPLCAECLKTGRLRPSEVTDHIVPHKGNMTLFWDSANWQPLCWRCHSRKTAKEDGRWVTG
jgi:5-methylcytosine-specific restriction enzyme A